MRNMELFPEPKGIDLDENEEILETTRPAITAFFGLQGILLTMFSAGIYLLVPIAAKREYEYIITTNRVVKRKNGFFGDMTSEIPIEKIYEIKTVGNPVSKLLGSSSGTVVFETKEDDTVMFKKLANHSSIADKVQENHPEGVVRNSANFN